MFQHFTSGYSCLKGILVNISTNKLFLNSFQMQLKILRLFLLLNNIASSLFAGFFILMKSQTNYSSQIKNMKKKLKFKT